MPAYVKTDRFGNAYQAKKAYVNDSGYAKAFVELGGKLYAIEFGQDVKNDERNAKPFIWVRVTSKPKRARATSM